jgi:IS30 family transposase
VTRHGGKTLYRPATANITAREKQRRPKTPKLVGPSALADAVRARISEGNSPWATAQLCRRDPTLAPVCAETIYRAIYNGTLDLKPEQCLRSRRRRRKPRQRGISPKPSNLGANVVGIADRPVFTGDGLVGQWEGDLIIGARNKSAAITLVEMSSGFQVVYGLGKDYNAERVAEQLAAWLQSTPAVMCRSLTWDRGSEMAGWEALTDGWDLPVYFCNPHSPWQRPKNENNNRQLRFWLPKGSDLSQYSQGDFDGACRVLNGEPRRQYHGQTAQERYALNQACVDRWYLPT